jgi:hypothetical protein
MAMNDAVIFAALTILISVFFDTVDRQLGIRALCIVVRNTCFDMVIFLTFFRDSNYGHMN